MKINNNPPVCSVFKCKRCHRPLKNEDSIALGYGTTCAVKEGVLQKKIKRTITLNKSYSIYDFIEGGV